MRVQNVTRVARQFSASNERSFSVRGPATIQAPDINEGWNSYFGGTLHLEPGQSGTFRLDDRFEVSVRPGGADLSWVTLRPLDGTPESMLDQVRLEPTDPIGRYRSDEEF